MTRAVMIVAAFLAAFAQNPSGTGEVRGRVLARTTNAPLAPALVSLTGPGTPPQRMMVGRDGAFAFRGVPAGRMTVTATKPGFLDATETVELGAAASIEPLVMKLQKQPVIAGRLLDDRRVPLVGVEVHALRRTLIAGASRFVDGPVTLSDDRGEYRLTGLTPGDYAILARPDPDPEMPLLMTLLLTSPAYAADVMSGTMGPGREVPHLDARVRRYTVTLYPSETSPARASIVSVAGDTVKDTIDLRLKSAASVRVSGTVAGITDVTPPVTVRLLPGTSEHDAIGVDAARTMCDESGRFEFAHVAPGQYVLAADADVPPGPVDPQDRGLSARVPIVVGARDLSGVRVDAHAGAFVQGHVAFNSAGLGPLPAQMAQIDIRLEPVDPIGPVPFWRARITGDGLRIGGIPRGRYVLRALPLGRWTVQSATLNGKDVLESPIEITGSDLNDLVITFMDTIRR